MTLIDDKTDAITPTIEHRVDEVLDARGRREQVYNFLDYHFETEDGYVRARTYLDKPRVVDLYPALQSRTSLKSVEAPMLLEAAMSYLKRRFSKVRTGAHP